MNTFIDVQNHLDSLGMFHMKPGQSRMETALKKLNLLPLPYCAVQVVGTNGKGSTSTFLSTLAQEYGLKVGLYTSPHFVSIKERILFQNAPIDDEIWAECADKVHKANPELTYFEFLTVLAALVYKKLNVDIAIFEAGLGGKFDATTALLSAVTVFTPIALDHASVLGNSVKEIAWDKARALGKHTRFAISAKQAKEAENELKQIAQKFAVPFALLGKSNKVYDLGLRGKYQQENAHIALETWKVVCKNILNIEPNIHNNEQALKKAFIAGRFQIIESEKSPISNCTFILDGGHNLHGLQALSENISSENIKIDTIICTCLDDKDRMSMMGAIAEIATHSSCSQVFIPELDNPRAIAAEELCNEFSKSTLKCTPFKNLDESLKSLQNSEGQTVLICGSLYLLAEFYTLYPKFLYVGN